MNGTLSVHPLHSIFATRRSQRMSRHANSTYVRRRTRWCCPNRAKRPGSVRNIPKQVSHGIGVFIMFSDQKWTLFQSKMLANYPGFVRISFLHDPRVNRYKNILEKICRTFLEWIFDPDPAIAEEDLNFPRRFSELSWNFPGISFRFLKSS